MRGCVTDGAPGDWVTGRFWMIRWGRPSASTALTGSIASPYPWVYRMWDAIHDVLAFAISRAESMTAVGWPSIVYRSMLTDVKV